MKKIVENSECIVVDMELDEKSLTSGFYATKLRIFKDRIEMDVIEKEQDTARLMKLMIVKGKRLSDIERYTEHRRIMKFNYEDLILMNLAINDIMHPKNMAIRSAQRKRK